MPDIQRTPTESTIYLARDERFHVHGQRVEAITIPRSGDLSQPATLHGSREVGNYRVAVETQLHPLQAEHAAHSTANPAAAAAIRGEINAGLRPARRVTLPSEALSQARPLAAQAAKIKPLVQ